MIPVENSTELTEFILVGITDDPRLQIPLSLVFTLVYLITLLGNLGVITLILLDSRLHTPMYFFLSNLSLADFGYSTAVTPKVMAGFLIGDKVISYNACAAQLFFHAVFIVEIFLLTSMAYDHYAAVCKPLYYTSIMTTSLCLCLVIDNNRNEMILFVLVGFNIIFSVLAILISYLFIFITILRMRSSEGHQKAFSTCASHLTAVSVFYGTGAFMYLLPSSNHSMDTDKLASVFYAIIVPMLNPLVYSLRNKDIKSAFKKAVRKAKSLIRFRF
ncbi:Olfactory receptor 5B12 [Camelus dromedarius]|uniref:Olfactory receptor 5B12 n=1 Tax=Camelus dromedarius TaxID=9838 RepID=A0A5N4DLI9_CAMDR|nr:Olfactory receptor 5B12 [Camelus dromedarius]